MPYYGFLNEAGANRVNSTTMGRSFSSLIPALERQDRVLSVPFSVIESAIANHAFPSASVAVTYRGQLIALKAFGHFTYESEAGALLLSDPLREGGNPELSPSTLFDLASLTKVVATTTMAMILYQRGLLDLEAPVAAVVPEFAADDKDPRRREITFRLLLAHSSGLPAYEKLYSKANTREELLHKAFTIPLAASPGTRAEYSDIGFITLGVALERIAGEPLDHFCQREIFGPLGIINSTFNPPQEMRSQIPPTADEREQPCGAGDLARETPIASPKPGASQVSTFRNRIIQGEVQDENASILGGVAGHAGVFSTAEDIARFAHSMLNGGRPILRPETVTLFTRRESTPVGTSRALGWDTPSTPSQSGKYFSPGSFGHLGYTGTSLWIDPIRKLSIALLTNRTWPDCGNQAIRQVRPKFHDAVIEALEASDK